MTSPSFPATATTGSPFPTDLAARSLWGRRPSASNLDKGEGTSASSSCPKARPAEARRRMNKKTAGGHTFIRNEPHSHHGSFEGSPAGKQVHEAVCWIVRSRQGCGETNDRTTRKCRLLLAIMQDHTPLCFPPFPPVLSEAPSRFMAARSVRALLPIFLVIKSQAFLSQAPPPSCPHHQGNSSAHHLPLFSASPSTYHQEGSLPPLFKPQNQHHRVPVAKPGTDLTSLKVNQQLSGTVIGIYIPEKKE